MISPSMKNGSTMMANALRLCERMATAAVEMRLIARLPVLVETYGEPYRALARVHEVRAIIAIDAELLDHARPNLHRAILAACDEVSGLIEGLDRHGWREVLLEALQVADPPGNLIDLDAYRARRAFYPTG